MGNDVSSRVTKMETEKTLPACKLGQNSSITGSKNVTEYADEKKLKQENQARSSDISSSFQQIQDVLLKLERLGKSVDEFDGARKDEQFRYLVESLLNCQIELDDIDSQDVENIRLKRRNAQLVVQKTLDELYDKTEWD